MALKKYQIHSADELDTPEERKGFTDYVDRLWKKGDIHRDKKEVAVDEISSTLAMGKKAAAGGAKKFASKLGTGASAVASAAGRSAKKTADAALTVAMATAKKSEDAAKEREKVAKEREKDQAAREREREQKDKEKERDQAGSAEKPAATDKVKKKKAGKAKKKKASGFLSKLKRVTDYDAPSQMGKKEASIPEGVKKTPGVSKKAQGAVGFAKHARKGTGAKRQFQKGVRQAGKKQARNEVSPPDRKFQVKGIKKHMSQKKGKDKIAKTYVDKKTGKRKETNPWALAWAQYDKYGVPSRIEKD